MTKILVIDDEVLVRQTLARILAGSGYQVIDAKDGNDGIEAVRRERPDLVITDILMPEKEGLETIMELRRESPATKIIAISGGGDTGNLEYLQAARRLGACDALAKPFGAHELLQHVRACLDRPGSVN